MSYDNKYRRRAIKYWNEGHSKKEIASEFGCSDVAVIKALRRLKISRKKTTLYRESDESFQQVFLEMLKTIPPESLIYVDECGIE